MQSYRLFITITIPVITPATAIVESTAKRTKPYGIVSAFTVVGRSVLPGEKLFSSDGAGVGSIVDVTSMLSGGVLPEGSGLSVTPGLVLASDGEVPGFDGEVSIGGVVSSEGTGVLLTDGFGVDVEGAGVLV